MPEQMTLEGNVVVQDNPMGGKNILVQTAPDRVYVIPLSAEGAEIVATGLRGVQVARVLSPTNGGGQG